MNRVSTAGGYNSALLDLMNAQGRVQQATQRISTEKIATDLAGYGRGAESLTTLTATQTRLEGFVATGKSAAARLGAQDLMMGRVYEGGTAAREVIANSLAAGKLDTLMTSLGLQYQTVQAGLNGQHQGAYLFAGGQDDTAPATARTMAELAAAPDAASTFANDTLTHRSRIDEETTVETGFLASDIGGPLTDIFRNIQAYQDGQAVTVFENGAPVVYTPEKNALGVPKAGTLTGRPGPAAEAFLKAQLTQLDEANAGVTNLIAKNGLMHNQVEAALKAHESQTVALENLMRDKSGYDPARAITDLQLAQVAIQASAQVLNGLRNTSLLDLLR